ncbi:MAG: type II secretion system F family protein [Sedimentisphaerales bacterium]|nr:type II secretion system F family protein [Sedimentisphaerales bacterium]
MPTLEIIGFALLFVYGVVGYTRPAIAFVTAPFVSIALGYVAWNSYYQENLLLAPVLFVVAMASVAASTHGSESREWYHRAALLLLVWLGLVLVVGVVLSWFNIVGASAVLPVLFIVGIILIVAACVAYGIVTRWAAAVNVFSTIGASIRQNLPLPMALDCAAMGRNDATSRVLRAIKRWMVKGYPLSEAIRRGYPQCPAHVLALLSAGERIDQLPAAVRAVEADMKALAADRTRLRPVHPAYPIIMLIILFVFTMGLLRFVVPQFKSMLEEMSEGQLPASTRMLIRIADPFMAGDGLPLLILLAAAIASSVWIYGAWRRRRPQRPYVLSRLGDSLKWNLPVLHWFERNRAMTRVVALLRMSLNAGCPVNEAIRGTLQLDMNLCFRRRLACWLRRVERGEPIGESARRCRLGNTLAWAFAGGGHTGDTPAVLEVLEAHYRSNYSYRVNLARFILWPAGIIALGASVGFVVFSIFSSIVAVVSRCAANVYP